VTAINYFHFPAEARAAVSAHMDDLAWMIPPWCRRIDVSWVADTGKQSAAVTVNYEYRFAEMEVCPLWLSQTEDVRRGAVIHELIHLHTNQLYNYAERTIKVLACEDEKIKVHLLDELGRHCEGATQDLADVVFARLRVAGGEK
jgi:hypothetical protein